MVTGEVTASYFEDRAVVLTRIRNHYTFTDDEYQALVQGMVGLKFEDREFVLCGLDPQYFIETYCQIYDARLKDWVPFHLWSEQAAVLWAFHQQQKVVVLKARQLGLSWLALCYALWMMIFRPAATILIFSKRDDESTYLLGDERVRGVYRRLPAFMKAGQVTDSARTWILDNGSVARAFPTTAGDSYTASLVMVDEAAIVPDLNRMMRSIKPTIDAGGKFFLISRANKDAPHSEFNNIYNAAKQGHNDWQAIFLPWYVHQDRDEHWYAAIRQDILERTGSEDELHEQYPATDTEALEPASKNKRIPAEWINACYASVSIVKNIDHPNTPPKIIKGDKDVVVYIAPEPDRTYCMGVDIAEGLPTSDDSTIEVLAVESGEQVCSVAGKYDPFTIAMIAGALSDWYNKAKIMAENNSIGNSTLSWLKENGYRERLLRGHTKKHGWTSSSQGKVILYSDTFAAFKAEEVTLHNYETVLQLISIEKNTLRAPGGEHDDRADAFALAIEARLKSSVKLADVGWL